MAKGKYKNLFVFILCHFVLVICHAAGGSIDGLVTFPGETPPRAMFANPNDPACPHGIAQNHLEVRQANLGLRNALVMLQVPGVREVRSGRAALQTQGCMLWPRIQWVPIGTSLHLINADGARHEIHAFLAESSVFDVLLSSGQHTHRPLVQPGFYKINCDRHLWERAWVYASENPYVAVTDAYGHFQLQNIPPGHYELQVWHEGWQDRTDSSHERPEYRPMRQAISVRVRKGRTSTVRFDNLEPCL